MRYCLQAFAKMQENASTTDKKIIDYIINNPIAITGMSIETLSEKTRTSYSSIARFCKRMGFDGFKDLKKQLIEELLDNTSNNDSNNGCLNIIQNAYDTYSKILNDCLMNVSLDNLNMAANAIVNARQIYFIGQGNSSITARYAYLKFMKFGFPCINDEDVTVIKTKTALVGVKDVIFSVSSSGRTKPILEASQISKSLGATIISLTDFYKSPLSDLSDIKLSTTLRDASQYLKEDIQLTSVQLILIDILLSICLSKLNIDTNDIRTKTKRQTETEKIR